MNVSPLDLRQQKFHRKLRGFDPVEVTSFLAAVADDYEQALRETDRLRQELMRAEASISAHKEHEKNLQSTLMTAQKVSDDIRATAEGEAQRIIRDAQARSELLLERTQARLEDVQREIDGLKLKRKDVETSIESTIQTLRNTLEYVREQEVREREGLVYAIHSGVQAYVDTGTLYVYAATDEKNFSKVLKSTLKVLRELKKTGVTEDELRRSKDHLKGSLMLSLESTSSRMNRLAKHEMHHGTFLSMDAMLSAIDTVRHEEVQALITDLLDEDRLALTTLGPLDRRNLPRELLHH